MPSGSIFAIFLMAELHKVERNAKGKLAFLFISERQVSSAKPELQKKRGQNKINSFFLCRVEVSSPSF